ncbi:MAG TPA: hypothetical protein VKY26_07565 [Actinomycetota bacterium]|nr:hypothetical protein [Actinomycetota bacterium]
MDESARAIMLGVRHRCGQEIQFWIPADLVSVQAERLDQRVESLGLTQWMQDEGILAGDEQLPQEDLIERLRDELSPRGIAFIDVDKDISECPSCGSLLRWLDILNDYAER